MGIRKKAEVKLKLLIIKYIHPRKIIQRAHNEDRYNSYILYISSNTAEIYVAVYFFFVRLEINRIMIMGGSENHVAQFNISQAD